MKWYYTIKEEHVHVRVFMNGALCGTLTFRMDEFKQLVGYSTAGESVITFEKDSNELHPH